MYKRLYNVLSRPYSPFLIGLLTFALVKLPALFEGFWYEDEGIYAAIGQSIIQGKALYAETWDHKPPFMYVLYSVVGRLGWGTGFTIIKVLAFLCGTITLVLIIKSLRLLTIRYRYQLIGTIISAILLGSPIIEGDVANAEVFFLPITAYLIYRLIKDSLQTEFNISSKQGIILGVLTFLAFTIKIPGFLEAGFITLCYLIMVFIRNRQNILKFLTATIIGFGVPLALLIAYFTYQGTLSNFVDAVFVANLSYTSTEVNVVHLGIFTLSLNIVKALLFLSTVVLSLFLFKKKKINIILLISILVIAIELFTSLLSGKPYPHYLQQLIPGVTLIIALLSPQIARSHLFIKMGLTILVTLIAIPIVQFFVGDHSAIVKHTFKDFYPGFVNQIVLHKNQDQFTWLENPVTRRNKDIALYFEHTYPESTYFLYSNQPWILAQISNRSTNKYTVAYQYGYLPRYLEEDRKNRNMAEYFILDTTAWRHEAFFEGMDQFEKIEDHNGFEIYKNKIAN